MAKTLPEKEQVRWPTLSEKERERRWEKMKELMKSRGLECVVVFGLKGREQFDRYLTNDRSGGIVIFPFEGELVHLTWATFDISAHLESALRKEASWVNDIRLGATGAGVVQVLKEKGFDQADIGVVGLDIYAAGELEGYIPYKTWVYILENLPYAKFHDISQPFAQMVAIKSEDELQLVRRAAEIGELTAWEMMNVTRPGVSESEIYAAMMACMYRNGATGSVSPYITPLILHSGPDNPSWGAPMWLVRPQPPRVVQLGDVVQAEIFPRYGSMEAQIQMSVAIEPVDKVNKECAAIARQSYEIGFNSLGPGKLFGDVVEAMEKPLKEAGAWHLTPLIHSLNPLAWVSQTGVGIENMTGAGNYKGIGPTPLIGADIVIKQGTVWELEPNACLGKNRVNIGGTVIVGEEGAIALNTLSTEMRIVS